MENNNHKRYLSIDIFKGLIILAMVFVNTLSIFDNVPYWTKHAPDYGLTYVDLIAPFFIFIMALNMNISYEKRIERDGSKETYFHFIKRYIVILGMGLFLSLNPEAPFLFYWGILQVLGVSGLILTIFIKFRIEIQIIVATLFVLLHQIILLYFFGDIIYEAVEGGILSSLGWGSLILFSSIITKGFLKGSMKKYFVIGGVFFLIIGIFTSFVWGVSRFRITLPFVFLSVGIASVLYYLFYFLFDKSEINFSFLNEENFLSIPGKNSLLLFILHIFIINVFYYLIPLQIETWIVFTVGFSHVLMIWVISFLLFRADIVLIL